MRLKLGTQVAALCVVLGLLGLLVWKILNEGGSDIPQKVAKHEHPVAPVNFSLPRLDESGTLSLASLRGKPIVLNFWASWCGPCREEVPALDAAWKRWRSQGLVVVGVDYDDVTGDARNFMRKYGMTYPAVHDARKKTVNAYGVAAVPETYFINRKGRIVGKHVLGRVSKSELAAGIQAAMRS